MASTARPSCGLLAIQAENVQCTMTETRDHYRVDSKRQRTIAKKSERVGQNKVCACVTDWWRERRARLLACWPPTRRMCGTETIDWTVRHREREND